MKSRKSDGKRLTRWKPEMKKTILTLMSSQPGNSLQLVKHLKISHSWTKMEAKIWIFYCSFENLLVSFWQALERWNSFIPVAFWLVSPWQQHNSMAAFSYKTFYSHTDYSSADEHWRQLITIRTKVRFSVSPKHTLTRGRTRREPNLWTPNERLTALQLGTTAD